MNWPRLQKRPGFGSYLRELSLIVIGILFALQIENWNTERKRSTFKNEALREVRAALLEDRQHIQGRLARLEHMEQSVRLFVDGLEAGGSGERDEAWAMHFRRCTWQLHFETRTAPYETLRSSGLDTIREPGLRIALIDLYDYRIPRMAWFIEQEFNDFTRQRALPLLYTYFQYRSTGEMAEPEWFIGDLQGFLQDTAVPTVAWRKLDRIEQMRDRLLRLDEGIEHVLELIRKERP